MCELDKCLDTRYACDVDVLLRALPQCTGVPHSINILSWEDWFDLSLYNSQGLCHCSGTPLCGGHHCSNSCGSAEYLQNELQEQDRKTVYKSGESLYRTAVGCDRGKLQATSGSGCCVGHAYFKTCSYPTTITGQDWENLHLFPNLLQIHCATAGGPLINLCTSFIPTL